MTIAVIRRKKMIQQGGRCYYCALPMWDSQIPQSECERLLGVRPPALMCTAEHLVAKCDGGPNGATNIVAACHFCNSKRHQRKTPLDPPAFQTFVTRRMRQGRWLVPEVKKWRQKAGQN